MAKARSLNSIPRKAPISRMYSIAHPAGVAPNCGIDGVDLGAVFHKELDDHATPTQRCVVKRGRPVFVALVYKFRVIPNDGFYTVQFGVLNCFNEGFEVSHKTPRARISMNLRIAVDVPGKKGLLSPPLQEKERDGGAEQAKGEPHPVPYRMVR